MLRYARRDECLLWDGAGLPLAAKTLSQRRRRNERQSLARPRAQLDSDPGACANAGLRCRGTQQLQSACFVRIARTLRSSRRMDRNFDNRLHAIANEWTVAMRCESRHHADIHSGLLIVNPAQHRIQQIWQVLRIGSQASPQELPARRHVSSLQFRSGARSTATLLSASETDSFSREAPHHEPLVPQ
jgi:hypothetical protein